MTPYELKPNDRIVFGTGSVFLYKNKDRGSESMPDDPEISFAFAMQEKKVSDDKEGAAQKAAEAARMEAETQLKLDELAQRMKGE